ncbi:MAG: DUF167 domain-containing protein [Planctomyces sp.]
MRLSEQDVSAAVSAHADGAVVRFHVQPGARRTALCGLHGERIRAAVAEPPEKGRATDAVLRLLADSLKRPVSAITLLRGQSSRQKDLLVSGVTVSEVVTQLHRLLDCR